LAVLDVHDFRVETAGLLLLVLACSMWPGHIVGFLGPRLFRFASVEAQQMSEAMKRLVGLARQLAEFRQCGKQVSLSPLGPPIAEPSDRRAVEKGTDYDKSRYAFRFIR
jgi:hypothetical protein